MPGSKPDFDLEEDIRAELREQFIACVVTKGLSPEEACSAIGFPLPLMIAYKDRDPQVAAMWDYHKGRKDRREALSHATPDMFRDVREIHQLYTRGMLEAGLFEKYFEYVRRVPDPEEDLEGFQKGVETLMRLGVHKQVVPTVSANHTQEVRDDLADTSDEELWAEVEARMGRIRTLSAEQEKAQLARRSHAKLLEYTPEGEDGQEGEDNVAS